MSDNGELTVIAALLQKADWSLSQALAYINNPNNPDLDLIDAWNPLLRSSRAPQLRATKAKLWNALSAGRLTATGIINGARRPIPAHDWQDLDLPRDPVPLLSRAARNPGGTVWDDISVRRDEVVQVFGGGKPAKKSTTASARTRNGAKTDLARVAINGLWPDGIPIGFSNGELHQQVIDWCKRNKYSYPPSKRTFDGIIAAAKKQNAK